MGRHIRNGLEEVGGHMRNWMESAENGEPLSTY
jgi:hypothetical protein